MYPGQSRVAHVPVADRRQEFVATVESVLPYLNAHAERLALYLALATFWGVVLYVALTSTLS